MPVRETIARNTVFNGIGRSWEAVLGLVLVAYIVSKIGVAEYGVWALVGAFTGYASLMDLGIGSAYAKYIAGHEARRERERISAVVSTGFFYYLGFGAVFVAAGWFGIDRLLAWMQTWPDTGAWSDSVSAAELKFLLRWSLVLFAASNCIAPFTSVQTGLQKMGVTNVIGVGSSVVKAVAVVTFLEAGLGLRGLMYANAVVLGVFGLASIVASFVILPSLRVAPWRASWTMFRRMFGFGWRTQVSRLSNLVTFETDVIVIMFVLRDVELVGLYKLGLELANKMRQIPVVLVSALLPAASQLDAANDGARLQRMYLRATKYVAALTIPLVAFSAAGAGLLMTAWQGTALELGVAAGVLRILAFGYAANVLPGPGVAIALGTGRPGLQTVAGVISMSGNIAMTLLFVFWFGFWGVPLATALSMGVSWAWFARAIGGAVSVPPGGLIASALKGPVVAVLAPALFVLACDALVGDVVTRPQALAVLAVVFAIFAGLYATLLRRSRFFDEEDFDFFEKVLKLDRVPGYAVFARPLRGG